ncbi:MAG: peptide chain release factor 1 [Candidatus Latescibacterota bacterium]|nr:MAG: peptide chain release factor 1 [Candidatus Latescibacterota bacterium]RKY74011.1 MAG: peptide chain release factor 1 [Candidatus Latescibacterota bacterium]
MFEKLEEIEKRYLEIEQLLADSQLMKQRERYRALAKEHEELAEAVVLYRRYKAVLRDFQEAERILSRSDGSEDPELLELARVEIQALREEKQKLVEQLQELLIPKDPNDEKNCILEIRAGTGGEEAGLFAGDLYRMYCRYADRKGWRVEPLSSTPTSLGGFKEIIFAVSGKGTYGKLKYESGVHRVQRVPVTESAGRIHTSAASVVVLLEAPEVEVQLNPDELKIEVFRSSGPGGQSVNTTDSAVRITHIPTGLAVQCQDERSQHKNKAKALKILRARLQDRARRELQEEISQDRKLQVGSGDRSAKIRTYNFPQNRVTDHRINLTLHKLDQILQGDMDELIAALQMADRAEKREAAFRKTES